MGVKGSKMLKSTLCICELSLNNVYPKKSLHVRNSPQILLYFDLPCLYSLYKNLNCIKVKNLQFLSMLIQQILGRGGQKCRPHQFNF